MIPKNVEVHKFGGKSQANSSRIADVFEIGYRVSSNTKVLVLSAMDSVTNSLYACLYAAKSHKTDYLQILAELQRLHVQTLKDLVPKISIEAEAPFLHSDFIQLKTILDTIALTGYYDQVLESLVSGYGEYWSSKIMSLYANSKKVPNTWIDSRKVIFLEHWNVGPEIYWRRSEQALNIELQSNANPLLIFPGYVASNLNGSPTTLLRNGSDHSAAIIANLINAKQLTIWTDVEGIFSADPHLVKDAKPIPSMTADEAKELAYFGAKVLHPLTLAPLKKKAIPLWIKSSLFPEKRGTFVEYLNTNMSDARIKGVALLDNLSVINVTGSEKVGLASISEKLFRVLGLIGVKVFISNQSGADNTISILIHRDHTVRTIKRLERTFTSENKEEPLYRISCIEDCSLVTIVGENILNGSSNLQKFFGALSSAGIKVFSIGQSFSSRSLSAIIATSDGRRAIQAAHSQLNPN